MRKFSFNFLDWVKKYIKLPTREESLKLLKKHSKKEIFEAYQEVYSLFKTKKSFDLQSIKNSLLLVAALFVLLGNVAQAGLPSIDSLEESYEKFFNTLDEKQMRFEDRGYNKKMFLNAIGEIEEVYQKIKNNKDFREDALQLKSVIDKFSDVKKNIDKIQDKDLIKAKTLAVHLQSESYFGYLANTTNR